MDPVNIDFVIGGNVDSEGKKIEQQFNNIADAVNDSRDQLKESVSIQKRVIKELEAELKSLEKSYEKTAPGNAKSQIFQMKSNVEKELQGEKAALKELDEVLKQSETSHLRLTTQIRAMTNELAQMEAEGKRNTPEFEELRQKLGQLTDQLGDAQKQAKILADDHAGLQGVIGGISGMSGAASVAVGTLSLFGAESDKLAQIQTRLQSLMAITIGLQQVANTLNKDSYFRVKTLGDIKSWWIGVVAKATAAETAETVATAASTTAQTANTAATGAQATAATAGTVANIGLAGAFKLVGAAIKSIPVFGWIIAGITGLIGVVSLLTSKAREAKKEQQEFKKSLIESASEPIASIENLSTRWKMLGDNMEAKKKFIEQNKAAFDELGVSINDVATAEKLLSDEQGKKAFIDAQIAKAKAMLYVQKNTDKIKKMMELEEEINGMSDYHIVDYSKGRGGEYKEDNKAKTRKKNELKALRSEITAGYENAAKAESEALQNMEKIGIKAAKQYGDGTIGALEEEISKRQAKLKNISDPTEYKKVETEIADFQKSIDKITGKTDKDSNKKNVVQDMLKQLADLNKGFEDGLELDSLKHQLDLESDVNKQMEIREAIRKKELKITLEQIEADKQKALAQATGATKEQKKTITDAYDKKAENAKTESNQEGDQAAELFKQTEALKTLENYQKYAERIVEIEAWKQEKIDEINNSKDLSPDEKAEKTKEVEILAQIDTNSAATEFGVVAETITEELMSIVQNTVTIGMEKIAEQLPVLEQELEKLKRDPNADQQKVAQLAAQVAKYRKQITKTKDEINKPTGDNVKATSEKFANASKILSGVTTVIGDIQDAFGDMLGDVGNDAMNIVQTVGSSTISVIGAMQSTGLAAGEAMSAVEKASVILAIVSAAVAIITSIVNLIAKNFTKNAQLRMQVEQYQNELKDLQREHDKFRDNLKKMSGQKYYTALLTDARNYSSEIAKIQQAMAVQEELINNTKSKKKREEREQELKEMQDELNDIANSQYDAFQSIFEELATTDLKGFAQSMADAMVEGFSQGAAGITDAFENTLDDLKKAMLKKQLAIALEAQFQTAFDYLKKATTNDAYLSQDEINNFSAMMADSQTNAEALAEQYRLIYDQMGLLEDMDEEENGIKGDVNNMTEETANALVGQITAMRLHVAAMLANSNNTIDTIGQLLAELRTISENTAYCQRLDRIDETLLYLKNNGVKIQ